MLVVGQSNVNGSGSEPTFSVSSPSFATTSIGVAVASSAVITNTSSVALSYSSSLLGGTNPHDFAVVGTTCASQLAPGATCNLAMTFTPHQITSGTRTGTLKVFMSIVAVTPTVMVSNTVALTGQES